MTHAPYFYTIYKTVWTFSAHDPICHLLGTLAPLLSSFLFKFCQARMVEISTGRQEHTDVARTLVCWIQHHCIWLSLWDLCSPAYLLRGSSYRTCTNSRTAIPENSITIIWLSGEL